MLTPEALKGIHGSFAIDNDVGDLPLSPKLRIPLLFYNLKCHVIYRLIFTSCYIWEGRGGFICRWHGINIWILNGGLCWRWLSSVLILTTLTPFDGDATDIYCWGTYLNFPMILIPGSAKFTYQRWAGYTRSHYFTSSLMLSRFFNGDNLII